MEERIQKLMARAGLGSRRDCEQFITQGRVTVNGKVALLGSKADPAKDTILVDGHKIEAEPLVYVALNKPRNVISTVDSPDPRPTVRDLVPIEGRLYPVGRLDIESEGLVLMTNDGELANRISHPRYGCEKEYRVMVPRQPDDDQLKAWRLGVVLEDGHKTAPAKVYIESDAGNGVWLKVIMHEGRKRQIREIGLRLGLPVQRLIRVRIGSLQLGKLKPREWRYLTPAEVDSLQKSAPQGDDSPRPRGEKRARPGYFPPKPKDAEQEPRHGGKPTSGWVRKPVNARVRRSTEGKAEERPTWKRSNRDDDAPFQRKTTPRTPNSGQRRPPRRPGPHSDNPPILITR